MNRCAKERKGIRDRIDGGKSDYLPTVVNVDSIALKSPQGSKIDDVTLLPKDGMGLWEAGQRIDCSVFREPSDPSTCIDRAGGTVVDARKKRAEVGKDTFLPSKGMSEEAVCIETVRSVGIGGFGVRVSGHRSSIVKGFGSQIPQRNYSWPDRRTFPNRRVCTGVLICLIALPAPRAEAQLGLPARRMANKVITIMDVNILDFAVSSF